MSAEQTPAGSTQSQLIQSYGDGRFRIAGEVHDGSILVAAGHTRPWPVTKAAEITADSLAEAFSADADILLIGCGPEFVPPPADLREAAREAGMVLEWMDTGGACRTFNVLLAEERPVIAALIAVE